MTLPTSLTKTFDTSLVDVNRSFSSTNTDTSGSSGKENQPLLPLVEPSSSTSHTASTSEPYEQWASTDDMDANVLQAIDDMQMREWMPHLIHMIRERTSNAADRAISVLDLGCGTGRNTLKLLQQRWSRPTTVVGWDASPAMLEIAKAKSESLGVSSRSTVGASFESIDFSHPHSVPQKYERYFDGLISSLVLEHVELNAFFAVVSKVLKPGGLAIVSNVHPDMGRLTHAGYKWSEREMGRGVNRVHTIEDTVRAAKIAGLEVLDEVKEVAVSEEMIEKGVVDNRGRRWVGVNVWYGLWLRAPGASN